MEQEDVRLDDLPEQLKEILRRCVDWNRLLELEQENKEWARLALDAAWARFNKRMDEEYDDLQSLIRRLEDISMVQYSFKHWPRRTE